MKIKIGKTTDYFLSSHTAEGYRSFFDRAAVGRQVITVAGASAQIRSRVCRQVGIGLVDRGYQVELIHGLDNTCDLEGIIVPELGLMMADRERIGASLAQVTPLMQVDLNGYIWADRYPIFEAKIKDLREQMAVNLDLVYEYLQQAQGKLVDDDGGLTFTAKQSSTVIERLAQRLFFPDSGRLVHRFGQSLTGEGQVNYYRGLLQNVSKKYFFNGVNYHSACKVLGELVKEASKAGLVCEVYHDFLEADLIELLIIPELSMAIAVRALDEDFKALLTYQDTACQPALTACTRPALTEDLGRITATLQEIKTLSGTVSELYQDVVNFEAIEQLEHELMVKVLQSAQERSE